MGWEVQVGYALPPYYVGGSCYVCVEVVWGEFG